MRWTVQFGTLLHLLFCALLVAVNFVCALDDNANMQADYNRFESKYFGENETYNSDKRLIIEDFYRQSSLAAKSIQEMSFRLNMSGAVQQTEHEATKNSSTQTTSPHSEDVLNKLESFTTPSRGNSTAKMPADLSSNKNDKWKAEGALSRLFHPSVSPMNPISSSNYTRNSTITAKSSLGHHGSAPLKKGDAPMLNLVYDSHIKHRHPDFRLGTHFDEAAVGSLINVTIQDGKTAFLNCKINLLQDKTVSWVRRMFYVDPSDETQQRQELQLLTVGTNTFVADLRYSVDFQFPNNFRLLIQNVTKRDEGIYECQISTHPPKVIQFYLQVNAPELYIADESQNPLYERHYEVNSTLELYCYVHNIEMTSSVVLWIHNDHVLNYDAIRGGISVRTDLTEEGANSTLSVAKINKSDSGNYTCSIGPTHSFTTTVHVLNESFAELFYHGCSVSLIKYQTYSTQALVLFMAFLLLSLSKLLNSWSSNECLSIR